MYLKYLLTEWLMLLNIAFPKACIYRKSKLIQSEVFP